MKVNVKVLDPLKSERPLVALPVTDFGARRPRDLDRVDAAVAGALTAAATDFTGKAGETLLLYPNAGPRRFLLIGLGEARAVDAEAVRRAAGKAASRAQSLKCEAVDFVLPAGRRAEEFARAAAEGLMLGGYVFNQYKTIDPKPDTLREATILVDRRDLRAAEVGARTGELVATGVRAVRDMVNTPAADWVPESFARTARVWGKSHGFDVQVKGPAELARGGFGGILAVGKGSAHTPRFVRMDYRGAPGAPVVLVGKGITFDTGGISIKPAADMDQMKGDMTGAAVVLATLATAARLKLRVHLIGLICSAENMPSGSAYRPGDIVRAYGGKTIEVLNTDAEGRVVLADGLAYAAELKPAAVIDLATLTGAIIIALGHHTAGLMSTDDRLASALLKASARTGEKLWRMPLDGEHDELVKSDIADVKNSAGRPASSCTAAAFLKTFTGDHPWAHLDIAGVDLEFKGLDYVPKGPSGFGVRLLLDYLQNLEAPAQRKRK
jgi:leucyl aminopeptidase